MSDHQIRLLALTVQDVDQTPGARKTVTSSRAVFGGLARQFELVALHQVKLRGFTRCISIARTVRPDMSAWKSLEMNNTWSFQQRSRLAQSVVAAFAGQVDVVFQVLTLFHAVKGNSPPYVIMTDNTHRLSLRHWPAWVPDHRPRERNRWLAQEQAALAGAALIFPFSQFAAQSIIEDYEIDPAKVIVTGAGGNLPVEPLVKTDYTSQIAVFVGYEFERKGGHILLQAWDQVRRRLPEARLHIIGPTQPLAATPDSVVWLGRIHNTDELQRHYREAAVFVLPSLFEPWGHVFIEAMGAGLPVIGTASCAMPEFITHDVNGLLVPPRDPDALADALVTILSDPQRARMMGRAAYQKAASDYDWDAVAKRMEPHLRRIASASPL